MQEQLSFYWEPSLLSDKKYVQIHMFSAGVKHWIMNNRNSAKTITQTHTYIYIKLKILE